MKFLIQRGHAGLLMYLKTEHRFGMDQLRQKYSHLFTHQAELTARNGIKYKSYAEVCFVNFMWARCIDFDHGKYYPTTFADLYGHRAVYDFHFRDDAMNIIDVEIFGGSRGGEESQEKYARVRKCKEEFNASNANFLKLECDDCFKDDILTGLLQPYFKTKIVPSRFLHSHDKCVDTAVWSIADQVMHRAQEIISNMPDHTFPSQHWFSRSCSYKSRQKAAWEDDNWGHYLNMVRILGGLKKVKTMLGQKVRRDWGVDDVIAVFRKCFHEYHISPSSKAKALYNKACRNENEEKLFTELTAAIGASRRKTLFPGQYREACALAGIKL